MRTLLKILTFWTIAICMVSCANRGIGPQGGPRDSIPPVVVKESPLNGTLRYNDKRIDITFDEYIQLDNVADNVIMSPPQLHQPDLKAVGKHLSIRFQDSLLQNTTYTIDFGKAICDFHEKIPMHGYQFAFSTGDFIDSLEIYGQIVNARNLNPMEGLVAGIHSNLSDSAFGASQFSRIARSDSMGWFAIHNIHEGQYRLYGLLDQNKDFIYQPGEGLAFHDDVLTPFAGDTSNIILWYFEEDKQRHYFLRPQREEAHRFMLPFSARQDSLPRLRALPPSAIDTLANDSNWVDWMQYAIMQDNPTHDSIVFWLTDSLAIGMDTLIMEMTYMKSDSLYVLREQIDTIRAVYRAPRMSEKTRKGLQKRAAERMLQIQSNASATFGANDTLRLTFDYPVATLHPDSFHLFEKKDTTYTPLSFTMHARDSIHMNYQIIWPYKPDHSYELRVDSAAVFDIYGHSCDKQKIQLKVRKLEEYATLRVKIEGDAENVILELLNDHDDVLRTQKAEAGSCTFSFLDPKVYYLRMYIDANQDGRWTTGDWATKRQPEPVYYFPKKLNLRANWEFEEKFNYGATTQLDSKPHQLLKKETGKKDK